jgi:hypothetical protein
MLSRRALIAAFVSLVVVSPVAAEERRVPAKKVFPYLDAYLRIPAAQRSRFTLGYVMKGARPAGLWLIDGETRTPIGIGPDGRLQRLPNLQQVEHGEILIAGQAKAKYSVGLEIEPLVAPAADMDAASLTAAVGQAAAAIKGLAGPLSLVLPKITGIRFAGGTGGEVVYADGRRAALPVERDRAVFKPAAHPAARTIHFAKPPVQLQIG